MQGGHRDRAKQESDIREVFVNARAPFHLSRL